MIINSFVRCRVEGTFVESLQIVLYCPINFVVVVVLFVVVAAAAAAIVVGGVNLFVL